MIERYHRQTLIEGWNQDALTEASVGIIGADYLGMYSAMPLAALGVGNLRLIDSIGSYNVHFLDKQLIGERRVYDLEDAIEDLNPNVEVYPIHSRLASNLSKYLLNNLDLVIDVTNDPRSKSVALSYCFENNIPMLSASCRPGYGKLVEYNGWEGKDVSYLLSEFENTDQDEFMSIVFGGLIADEAVKILMDKESRLQKPAYYNLTVPDRSAFGIKNTSFMSGDLSFKEKRALIVGAGALGWLVGYGLTKLHIGSIDIIDDDEVVNSNLNRQLIYYDAVGESKAEVLAEKLQRISIKDARGRPIPCVKSFNRRFDSTFTMTDYDVVFDCVDNFNTRHQINKFCVENHIPLISGGTNATSGQCAVYVPGKTSCVDDKVDLASKVSTTNGASCLLAPDPSVIMPNQVVAGIMINESRTVFNPSIYKDPINSIILYDSIGDKRIGLIPYASVCECHKQYEPRKGRKLNLKRRVKKKLKRRDG